MGRRRGARPDGIAARNASSSPARSSARCGLRSKPHLDGHRRCVALAEGAKSLDGGAPARSEAVRACRHAAAARSPSCQDVRTASASTSLCSAVRAARRAVSTELHRAARALESASSPPLAPCPEGSVGAQSPACPGCGKRHAGGQLVARGGRHWRRARMSRSRRVGGLLRPAQTAKRIVLALAARSRARGRRRVRCRGRRRRVCALRVWRRRSRAAGVAGTRRSNDPPRRARDLLQGEEAWAVSFVLPRTAAAPRVSRRRLRRAVASPPRPRPPTASRTPSLPLRAAARRLRDVGGNVRTFFRQWHPFRRVRGWFGRAASAHRAPAQTRWWWRRRRRQMRWQRRWQLRWPAAAEELPERALVGCILPRLLLGPNHGEQAWGPSCAQTKVVQRDGLVPGVPRERPKSGSAPPSRSTCAKEPPAAPPGVRVGKRRRRPPGRAPSHLRRRPPPARTSMFVTAAGDFIHLDRHIVRAARAALRPRRPPHMTAAAGAVEEEIVVGRRSQSPSPSPPPPSPGCGPARSPCRPTSAPRRPRPSCQPAPASLLFFLLPSPNSEVDGAARPARDRFNLSTSV